MMMPSELFGLAQEAAEQMEGFSLCSLAKFLANGGGAATAALFISRQNPIGVNIALGSLAAGLGFLALSSAVSMIKQA
jgi:hypothetical protein